MTQYFCQNPLCALLSLVKSSLILDKIGSLANFLLLVLDTEYFLLGHPEV